ncbi:Glyoxalase/Bleomycin resistance protein/Dihydroxybiphenyl dioxygenase [Hyaloraphidium curvatum]|nr:Glyoxalase/Bleomycin resistance protein/Dihydroxybiphenyl dioxygenase [Hyaloraphidium curvatum]
MSKRAEDDSAADPAPEESGPPEKKAKTDDASDASPAAEAAKEAPAAEAAGHATSSSLFDHISLPVTDFEKSKAFYLAALKPLGVESIMEFGKSVGMGKNGEPSFWIDGTTGADVTTPKGQHLAFSAPTRKLVDEWYEAAIAAGGTDNGKPGLRKDYSPTYYGAFVLDPDGHRIEAVCHAAEE